MHTTKAVDFEKELGGYMEKRIVIGRIRTAIAEAEVALDILATNIADSLLAQPNPRTGKPHSWTSAVEESKLTPQYLKAVKALIEQRQTLYVVEGELSVIRWRLDWAATDFTGGAYA